MKFGNWYVGAVYQATVSSVFIFFKQFPFPGSSSSNYFSLNQLQIMLYLQINLPKVKKTISSSPIKRIKERIAFIKLLFIVHVSLVSLQFHSVNLMLL